MRLWILLGFLLGAAPALASPVRDDTLDQYIRDILDLLKTLMPTGIPDCRQNQAWTYRALMIYLQWEFLRWIHLRFPTSTFLISSKTKCTAQPKPKLGFVFLSNRPPITTRPTLLPDKSQTYYLLNQSYPHCNKPVSRFRDMSIVVYILMIL